MALPEPPEKAKKIYNCCSICVCFGCKGKTECTALCGNTLFYCEVECRGNLVSIHNCLLAGRKGRN